MINSTFPPNTRYRPDIGLMLGKRRRRWTSNKPALGQSLPNVVSMLNNCLQRWFNYKTPLSGMLRMACLLMRIIGIVDLFFPLHQAAPGLAPSANFLKCDPFDVRHASRQDPFNPLDAGTDFKRNLTSVDVRFWRLKTVPALRELGNYNGRIPIT